MKDKFTRVVLLRGKLKDGLYQFHEPVRAVLLSKTLSSQSSSSFSSCAFINKCTSSSYGFCIFNTVGCFFNKKVNINTWHRKLGHASINVLRHVLQSCNNASHINKVHDFHSACQYGKSHSLPFTLSQTISKEPFSSILIFGEQLHSCLEMAIDITNTFVMTFLGSLEYTFLE